MAVRVIVDIANHWTRLGVIYQFLSWKYPISTRQPCTIYMIWLGFWTIHCVVSILFYGYYLTEKRLYGYYFESNHIHKLITYIIINSSGTVNTSLWKWQREIESFNVIIEISVLTLAKMNDRVRNKMIGRYVYYTIHSLWKYLRIRFILKKKIKKQMNTHRDLRKSHLRNIPWYSHKITANWIRNFEHTNTWMIAAAVLHVTFISCFHATCNG